MSASTSQDEVAKLAVVARALQAEWSKVKPSIDGLDKDAWHKAKNDAGIKKTKWYQSASAIGPKIDKVKSSSKSFTSKMSSDSFISLLNSLDSLEKECKDFWTKHKDAKQEPGVVKALDEYAKIAKDTYASLAKFAPAMEKISKAAGSNNIDEVFALRK